MAVATADVVDLVSDDEAPVKTEPEEQEICAICQEPMDLSENRPHNSIRFFPECGHPFHYDCVWDCVLKQKLKKRRTRVEQLTLLRMHLGIRPQLWVRRSM